MRRAPRVLAGLAAAGLCAPGCAGKRKRDDRPQVVTPDDGIPADVEADEDLSAAGARRGVLEYSLGGFTAGLSVALIAFGGVQLHRGVELREFCTQAGSASSPECQAPLGHPATNYLASGGLSLSLSVPIAVASGFLFRRAVRIHRDYRTWKKGQVALRPWVGRGGGLSLSLRF